MWTNIGLIRVKHSTTETFTTDFGLKLRRFISPFWRWVLRLTIKQKVHVESYPKLNKGETYIFASTHSFVEDVITTYAYTDRNAYMLSGTTDQVEHNPQWYAAWVCGMVYVNRLDPAHRKASVDKMARVLKSGSSIIMFPEGGWNNTENLIVQPLFSGPYQLACRTGCKVVPVAVFHEYNGKEIHMAYGEPMDLTQWEQSAALDELRDAMATMMYDMMEKYGTLLRRETLGPDPRMDYMIERKNEYLRTLWTRDSWSEEIAFFHDRNLPPPPEEIWASFDGVRVTPQNAPSIVPIQARSADYKKYDFVKFMQENWDKC